MFNLYIIQGRLVKTDSCKMDGQILSHDFPSGVGGGGYLGNITS